VIVRQGLYENGSFKKKVAVVIPLRAMDCGIYPSSADLPTQKTREITSTENEAVVDANNIAESEIADH
jgi:hypothetical protein